MNKSLLVAALLLLLVACKKNQAPNVPMAQPLKKEHGAALGNPVTKVIGPAGGSISSADGNISIEIPAGTVTGDTPFSIQPIEKTLDQSTGTAFRLGPENITFQKDLKITFKYSDEDLEGSAEDYLYLTYQDKEGHFYRQMKTDIDKANKTLFVNTRHFSDWYIERVFTVAANRMKLSAGQQADILLFYNDTDPYGQVVVSNEKIKDETWFINGPGTVTKTVNNKSFNLVGATYKAPASIVSPTTVAVGAQIKNMVDKLHPDRVGTSGLVIVQTPITLVPEEFITWEFNGVTHTGVSMDAGFIGFVTNILGVGSQGNIALTVNASKAGTYDLGSNAEPDKFNLTVGQASRPDVIYKGDYSICNDPIPKYGKGKVVIESYGSIGGFISGNFSATVYNPGDGCQPQGKLVKGSFKLRRKV
ncbi:hypothetical protein [Pedobacter sp. ASV28]|uniref:hypothetical protein n=1 Tax=Pedobacter sp. ASV28 TaxID=2795123 RepID=UPI0018EBA856|nr:hypothetical protein [Pedobacter sp. ASV28]